LPPLAFKVVPMVMFPVALRASGLDPCSVTFTPAPRLITPKLNVAAPLSSMPVALASPVIIKVSVSMVIEPEFKFSDWACAPLAAMTTAHNAMHHPHAAEKLFHNMIGLLEKMK
jgi:hypothetical protein